MITREELAKELNVSRATVSKNEARGMPVDDVTRARRWRKKHIQKGRMKGVRRDSASGEIELPTTAPNTPETDDDDDCNDIDPEDTGIRSYQGARDRREHYQAELARLNFERESGQLMVSSEVVKVIFDVGTSIRLALEALPPMVSPVLVNMTDEFKISQLLNREIFRILKSMSQQFQRLAENNVEPQAPQSGSSDNGKFADLEQDDV